MLCANKQRYFEPFMCWHLVAGQGSFASANAGCSVIIFVCGGLPLGARAVVSSGNTGVVTAQNSKDKLEKLGAVGVLLVTVLRLPGILCQGGPANTGQCTDSHTFPTSKMKSTA